MKLAAILIFCNFSVSLLAQPYHKNNIISSDGVLYFSEELVNINIIYDRYIYTLGRVECYGSLGIGLLADANLRDSILIFSTPVRRRSLAVSPGVKFNYVLSDAHLLSLKPGILISINETFTIPYLNFNYQYFPFKGANFIGIYLTTALIHDRNKKPILTQREKAEYQIMLGVGIQVGRYF